MFNLRRAIVPMSAMAAAAMVAMGLAGCGGSSSGEAPSSPVTFAVDWAERSRAISGPASALSFRFELVNAQPNGKNVVLVADRNPTIPNAHTENYTTTDRSMAGTFQMNMQFFSEPGGEGSVVGTASAQVTINNQGGGIPNISTTSTVKTLTVQPGQTIKAGSRAQLAFTALGDEGVIAVSPGTPVWEVVQDHGHESHDHDVIEFENGFAHGVRPGIADVRAAIIVGGGVPPIVSEVVDVEVTMSDFRTILTPGQVVGSVVDEEGAFGIMHITFMSDSEIGFSILTHGLPPEAVTRITLRHGQMGITGPAVAELFAVNGHTFHGHLSGVIRESDIIVIPGGPVTIPQLQQEIEENRIYASVATTNNHNGAIRGQLGGSLTMVADVSGAQEVPPVLTDANLIALVKFNATMTQFRIEWENAQDYPNDITMGHIHNAIAGSNGPVMFWLFNQMEEPGAIPNPFNLILDPSYLIPSANIPDFDAAIGAMLSGEAYINIHSLLFPGGITRGQIVNALG